MKALTKLEIALIVLLVVVAVIGVYGWTRPIAPITPTPIPTTFDHKNLRHR